MPDDENRPEGGGSRTSATKSLPTVPDSDELAERLRERLAAARRRMRWHHVLVRRRRWSKALDELCDRVSP